MEFVVSVIWVKRGLLILESVRAVKFNQLKKLNALSVEIGLQLRDTGCGKLQKIQRESIQKRAREKVIF
ncbi:MAG: hypothetical protein CME32_26980 [Gimesia sp.]|nr:hypothetical protein [Gimesia sp.]